MSIQIENVPTWVTGCARCNRDQIFEDLAEIVKRDVEEMNSLPAKDRRSFRFKFETIEDSIHPSFRVSRVDEKGLPGELYVLFEKWKHSLHILEAPFGQLSIVKLHWDIPRRVCLVEYNGDHMPVWQLSSSVLSSLYFGLERIDVQRQE